MDVGQDLSRKLCSASETDSSQEWRVLAEEERGNLRFTFLEFTLAVMNGSGLR